MISLASDCSAALERGDKTTAKRLAEQGLELATRTGDAKWMRRFQHLLRVASDQSIPNFPQPHETRPHCNFCLMAAGRITITVTGAVICDDCVKRCVENRLQGSAIERLAGDVECSFCHSSPSARFGARGYAICERCIQWILRNWNG